MPFDDPIYLDRDSFEELMVDTDEHRLCWMYHDLLSSARICGQGQRRSRELGLHGLGRCGAPAGELLPALQMV